MNLWQQADGAQLIALSILIPFIGALLVIATGRWPNLREAVTGLQLRWGTVQGD